MVLCDFSGTPLSFATMATNITNINTFEKNKVYSVGIGVRCGVSYFTGLGTAIMEVISDGSRVLAWFATSGYCWTSDDLGNRGEAQISGGPALVGFDGHTCTFNMTVWGKSDDWGGRVGTATGQIQLNIDTGACVVTNIGDTGAPGGRLTKIDYCYRRQ